TVVFDKTGTLTQGNWCLESIEALDGRSPEDIVALACALEGDSRHAVARAVWEYARSHGIEPADVSDRQVAPEGVSGLFQGQRLRVGSRPFVMGEGEAPAPALEAGCPQDPVLLSSVYLGARGRLWAVLKFGDAMRPGLSALIPWVRANIGDVHLISGDSPRATEIVAARLGIAAWQGGLYPRDKEAYIERLQAAGHQVLMVGDGINDAPALARADLAVAVYSGAPLAREAAQVTLMRGSPSQLMELLHWSRHVDGKVRQNIWCAFGYNLISIPVAMSGLLNPLVAVTAMLMSSLTVIGNTLLLVRRKPFVMNGARIQRKANS
ncbi:MAG: HAD-IC family P-type ATPase, partial [Desulfosarcinaceae bacterium]